MHVYQRRDGSSIRRENAANVVGDSRRRVETAPTEQLGSPGYVGILAVGEKVRVKEAIILRNISDHGAPVQRCGTACTEDVLRACIAPSIELFAAAIEMTKTGSEVDSCRVEQRLGRKFEIGSHSQQLTGDTADL